MTSPAAPDGAARQMLAQAFAALGASPAQAEVMAAQLVKRARQIAAERGISEAEAMRELLAKVVSGRRGEYTGQPPQPPSPPYPSDG